MSSSETYGGDLATFSIKVAGSAIPDVYQVHAIHIEKRLNKISVATLTILDGDAAKEGFPVSSADVLVPGSDISISAGYENKNSVIFEGVITQQRLRVDNSVGSALEIECKDKAVKMTVGRKSGSFSKMTDSDVMSKLIGNASGVTANVTATSATLPELVQYYTTDWDFVLARAEVNGMVVSTLNGKLSVFKPEASTDSVLTITYGQNLYAFQADLNSVTQLAEVKASAWDYKTQKLVNGQASNSLAGPGNLSSKKLSDVVGLSEYELQTTAAIESDGLTNWAKAQMLKSELAKIQGEVRIQGSDLVDPGVYITLAGLGTRFNGDHLVSSVTHDISEGNWFSEIEIGLSHDWFIAEPDVVSPTAAGLLPGVQGLFNATVKKINDDPDSEYRILIDLPLFNSNDEGQWARLSNFYSTSGAGAFFLPEVGDEVVVGFLNDDPRYPIILGSLYSSKNKPYSDLTPNEKNSHKAIVTKSELRVVFDDENSVLTITTSKDNVITLSDQDKQISIKDQNSNSIVMSDSGITMKSPNSINIEADQNLTLKGNTGVTIQSSGGDVAIKGMNVQATGDMEFSAKGNMTASVQGGTQLTLKGAMVMIN